MKIVINGTTLAVEGKIDVLRIDTRTGDVAVSKLQQPRAITSRKSSAPQYDSDAVIPLAWGDVSAQVRKLRINTPTTVRSHIAGTIYQAAHYIRTAGESRFKVRVRKTNDPYAFTCTRIR